MQHLKHSNQERQAQGPHWTNIWLRHGACELSATCPPLTVLHLANAAGPCPSVPALCLGIRSLGQAWEIQDMAPPGQEGGPLWPRWHKFGRESWVRVGFRGWCHEGLVLNQWHLYKYRQQSPNPVLKCSTDLLLYHDTHRFARTEYTQTLLVVGYTPCEVLAALV